MGKFKVLQLKLAPPTLPHTCFPNPLKMHSDPWSGRQTWAFSPSSCLAEINSCCILDALVSGFTAHDTHELGFVHTVLSFTLSLNFGFQTPSILMAC